MKQTRIKVSTRGKTKRTLRKVSCPEARKLYKMSSDLKSIARRMNSLANSLDILYISPKSMAQQTALDSAHRLAQSLSISEDEEETKQGLQPTEQEIADGIEATQ